MAKDPATLKTNVHSLAGQPCRPALSHGPCWLPAANKSTSQYHRERKAVSFDRNLNINCLKPLGCFLGQAGDVMAATQLIPLDADFLNKNCPCPHEIKTLPFHWHVRAAEGGKKNAQKKTKLCPLSTGTFGVWDKYSLLSPPKAEKYTELTRSFQALTLELKIFP